MSFDQAIVGRDSRAVEPGSRGSIRLQVPQHVDLQPLFEHQVGQRQVENVVIQRRDRGSGDEPIAAHEGLRRSAMFVAGARAGRGVGHAVRVLGEDAIPGLLSSAVRLSVSDRVPFSAPEWPGCRH